MIAETSFSGVVRLDEGGVMLRCTAHGNSGFVVLALLAERATDTPFPRLVDDLVCRPAGMAHTAFLRSNELPGDAALGYLGADGLRPNLLHLPVLGSGDGGVWSTVDDVHALWLALFAGRIVELDRVAEMVRPRSATPSGQARYGLGFWLKAHTDAVEFEGYDAGVSFRTVHQRAQQSHPGAVRWLALAGCPTTGRTLAERG